MLRFALCEISFDREWALKDQETKNLNTSSQLNERQAEAIETRDGALLIVAGAGSGKTRVITHRIAWLLSKEVAQSEILAVTFTNKAAREMAQRVRELIPRKTTGLTVCTFHAQIGRAHV